ncbi:MAG: DEAD/DEAH box helicase [Candidatus Cloacimonetes bacterium]|nr:DEAD/DEAH box helicase [Candidatus Cloacimonadota bacterium]
MAKLFGSDYHEHSNTWYFKDKMEKYRDEEVSYDVVIDESGNYVFSFLIKPVYDENKKIRLKIKYSLKTNRVENYQCSECDKPLCKHYLSILQFAYHSISSQILEKRWVVTYQSKLTVYNEYWQKVKLNSQIHINGLTDPLADKVKFIFKNYDKTDIFMISLKFNNRLPEEMSEQDSLFLETVYPIFSQEELTFIDKLISVKCSVSRKNNTFSVHKNDFSKLIMYLKPILNKIVCDESGSKLKISDEVTKLNLVLEEIDAYNFRLQVSDSDKINNFFPGNSSYIMKEMTLYPLDLPLDLPDVKKLFENSFFIKRHELVYLVTVLKRQLNLASCSIDIPESIVLPDYYENPPNILLVFEKEHKNILMKAYLKYAETCLLPLSLLNLKAELIEYKVAHHKFWFYITPNLEFEIREFCHDIIKIPYLEFTNESQYCFKSKNEIEHLKKSLFEFSRTNWEIQIAEEIRNEFIYRITLKPVFKLSAGESIDWFSYELSYEANEINISQDELRNYFKSEEKFLKTQDGKLVFINNREVFEEVEGFIKKSQKDNDKKFKTSLYKLPWIYQLSSINPAIQIYGDEYLNTMYDNLLNRKMEKSPDINVGLRAVMRSYQKSGFAWIKMLEKYRLNGILADDMGLGKTLQAISVIATNPHHMRYLIVCPKTLLFNWANEFDKFAPQISYLIYEGSKEERTALISNAMVQVVLCSYAIVQNDLNELQALKFDYIILDEAQHIKNPNTHRSKSIKKLNSNHKLALTGTPLENNITELWSIFDFLMPGYLPSLIKFKKLTLELANKPENNVIQRYISPFILRRKKQEVLIELPDKQEQTIFCQMSEIQEKYYLEILNSVKKEFDEAHEKPVNYIHLLAALTRLRQICDHPYLIDRNVKTNPELSGKAELLEELLLDTYENGKKFLIFSQYISMLEILREILIKHKIPFEYLDGSVQDRQRVIDHFNTDTNVRAFLISLKTGGYGINLTSADTVIIVDPWWNPMLENQAIDRAYRIGQTQKVNVYRLITKGTVEEKIMLLQQTKKSLFDCLIEGGEQLLRHLSVDELKKLFDYK